MYRPLGPCVSTFVHFLDLTRPGAAIGLVLAVLLLPAYAVLCLKTGFGPVVDAACGLLVGVFLLLSVTSVTMLGLVVVRHIPVRFGAMIVTAVVCLIVIGNEFGFSPALSVHLGALPILLLLLAGAGTSILLRRGPGGRARYVPSSPPSCWWPPSSAPAVWSTGWLHREPTLSLRTPGRRPAGPRSPSRRPILRKPVPIRSPACATEAARIAAARNTVATSI